MKFKNKIKVEKQEFKYPMWFKSKLTGDIVEFSGLNEAVCIYLNPEDRHCSYPHTDTILWEQVENPRKDLK